MRNHELPDLGHLNPLDQDLATDMVANRPIYDAWAGLRPPIGDGPKNGRTGDGTFPPPCVN